MSEASQNGAMRGGGGSAITIGVAVLAGVLILAFLFIGGRDPRLSSSATGFEGLRYWLEAEGQGTRSFGGGYPIDPASIGLRVLPLFDAELDARRPRPETREDVLFLDTERELRLATVRQKVSSADTLIILPKWRMGMRLTDRAHPDFLIPDARLSDLVEDIMGPGARLQTIRGAGIAEVPVEVSGTNFNAALYAPRGAVYASSTGRSPSCSTEIGVEGVSYLLRCDALTPGGSGYWVLTDPDLLNNHGLSLGDNAALAASLLPTMAVNNREGEETVLIDYSDGFWTRSVEQAVAEPRTLQDIQRFFAWPYTLIWISLGGALALALWRSSIRGGPAHDGRGNAPLAPIEAEARLLTLSGEAGRLLGDYSRHRMTALTHHLLGPRAGAAQLARILPRRAPEHGPALLRAAEQLRGLPSTLPPEAAMARMRHFETLIEHVTHEFD